MTSNTQREIEDTFAKIDALIERARQGEKIGPDVRRFIAEGDEFAISDALHTLILRVAAK